MQKQTLKLPLFLIFLLIVITQFDSIIVLADEKTLSNTRPASYNQVSHSKNCFSCHSNNNLVAKLENGETISLFVDFHELQDSVHNDEIIQCEECHSDQATYPHRDGIENPCIMCHEQDNLSAKVNFDSLDITLPYNSVREMSLSMEKGCANCHLEITEKNKDSVHSQLLEYGNPSAPSCIDCHGSHGITPPDEPRQRISETCSTCHLAVYSTYQNSVHGEALAQSSNLDVPTCVDCHGIHDIRGPHDLSFRNDSIFICGGCHSDAELMKPYDISTNVFKTYLDDFHGRSVNLARLRGKDRPSYQAVCFDCHGIHNILSPDNPNSTVYPNNLQTTCERCHTDATISFPQAWLSHYAPEPDTLPILYVVNIAYPILIGVTIGGMFIYIILDFRRRLIESKTNTSI
jgi:hypothetical protein